MSAGGIVVREATDDDGEGVIALITRVLADFPGCAFDVSEEFAEMYAPAIAFGASGGGFFVAERDGRMIGCVGWTPARSPDGVNLHRLYVLAEERGAGVGGRLCDAIEAVARARSATFVDLWSESCFAAAHRFYHGRGFRRRPEDDLGDAGCFRKPLPPEPA